MPTNQEFLTQLATESPDKLKAWFDAEHNDNLAAEKVVSGDAAHSNNGNAHLKASEDLSDAFSDSREKLEAEAFNLFNEWSTLSDDAAAFLTGCVAGFLDRQAAITERETNTSNKSAENVSDSRAQLEADLWKEIREYAGEFYEGEEILFALILAMFDRQAAITEQQTERKWCCYEGSVQAEIDRLQRRNDELRTSYDKLKRERDNLADDLLTCNREREQLRKHLGIALDHAHDICSLVDIDGNVLDVGE